MSTCQPRARDHLQRAARRVEVWPAVVATTVLSPAETPQSRWTLEVVVEGATAPPQVLQTLAEHDCAIDAGASGVRGQPPHTLLVVAVA